MIARYTRPEMAKIWSDHAHFEAMRQVESWRLLYGRNIVDWVSVNLSARQIEDPDRLIDLKELRASNSDSVAHCVGQVSGSPVGRQACGGAATITLAKPSID